MADISYMITKGIGSPASIARIVTFGLSTERLGTGTRDVLYVEPRANLELGERATLHVPARKDVTVDN